MTGLVLSGTRQPFGELGHTQLERLSAVKNIQNAIVDPKLQSSNLLKDARSMPMKTIPSKRPMIATKRDAIDDEDSENVDPEQSQRYKRAKAAPTTPLNASFDRSASSIPFGFGKINVQDFSSSPATLEPHSAQLNTPRSPAAGRSPKHKRIGVLSRRRISASPFKRIEPPLFESSKHSSPLSIDAALKGTLPSYQKSSVASSGPKDFMPKSWFFQIHEDSPDEEAANLMEHSTFVLDLSSDDEDRKSTHKDERGKENIPPADAEVIREPVQHREPNKTLAEADAMCDDCPRTPLENLEPSKFYDTGLDETSVEVVRSDTEPILPQETISDAAHPQVHDLIDQHLPLPDLSDA